MANEAIDQEETFLKQINTFADEHPQKKVIVLGAGDNYINMITKMRQKLAKNIIVPFISHELMDNLQKKIISMNSVKTLVWTIQTLW